MELYPQLLVQHMPEVFEVTATVEVGLGVEAVDKSHAEQKAKELILGALSSGKIPGGFHPRIVKVSLQPRRT